MVNLFKSYSSLWLKSQICQVLDHGKCWTVHLLPRMQLEVTPYVMLWLATEHTPLGYPQQMQSKRSDAEHDAVSNQLHRLFG